MFLIYLRQAVHPAFVPLQEVLLCPFPVSVCSSFQGILESGEAVHQPHHEVRNPGADGHDVWPLVGIRTQTPDGKLQEVKVQHEYFKDVKTVRL